MPAHELAFHASKRQSPSRELPECRTPATGLTRRNTKTLPMRERSLSIGIVTYQSGAELVGQLLDSVIAAVQTAVGDGPVDVAAFVVCNDDSRQHVDAISGAIEVRGHRVPGSMRIELVQGHGNIGYGAAQNLAIKRSSAQFHLVLNPDVVLDENALLESARFLEANPDAVMAVPQGFDGAGRYAALAKRAPSVLVLLLRALSVSASPGLLGRLVGRYTYSDRLPADRPEAVELASGCFMFCRTAALATVGGFDEGYFLYFEDYDLSRRIGGHGGIYEVPGVRICHHGGRTARRGARRIAQFLRSGVRYFNRYGWRFF